MSKKAHIQARHCSSSVGSPSGPFVGLDPATPHIYLANRCICIGRANTNEYINGGDKHIMEPLLCVILKKAISTEGT